MVNIHGIIVVDLTCQYVVFQALVLVHDVGPNWELVSDIINSSLQIKVNFLICFTISSSCDFLSWDWLLLACLIIQSYTGINKNDLWTWRAAVLIYRCVVLQIFIESWNWFLLSRLDVAHEFWSHQCIFRKPKDCKECHKSLMERNSGDGGDSREDSGFSQPCSIIVTK